MEILRLLFGLLSWSPRPGQGVSGHMKRQAFGPRWSLHRPRRIERYTRKRPRRGWW